MSKTTTEIAERIANADYSKSAVKLDRAKLADAIDRALQDYGQERDERAAKIVEAKMRERNGNTKSLTLTEIIEAIRSNEP